MCECFRVVCLSAIDGNNNYDNKNCFYLLSS